MKKTTSFRIEATKNDESSSFYIFVFNNYYKKGPLFCGPLFCKGSLYFVRFFVSEITK